MRLDWGAVAGACVDHRSGQTRMPPQERRHEGLERLGVLIRCAGRALERPFGAVNDVGGDSFAVGLGAVAGACVGRGSGQPRMPPRERQHEGLWGVMALRGIPDIFIHACAK